MNWLMVALLVWVCILTHRVRTLRNRMDELEQVFCEESDDATADAQLSLFH